MANWTESNVSVPGFGDTPMMVAVLVLGALAFLVAMDRGFRGIKIG